MAASPPARRLPLFPLPNVVHFPRTELRLHVFEHRYRALVRDLGAAGLGNPRIGMVLLKPGEERTLGGHPQIFSRGTAGRLVAVEPLADGRYNIVLRGEFRFAVEREFGDRPYRQAVVKPLPEPDLDEDDPALHALRSDLLEAGVRLRRELGARFPLDEPDLAEIAELRSFEAMVNRVAADLDLPALRKLELLEEPLPDRALSVLALLLSRQKVLDLLKPFRHLAAGTDVN